MPDEEVVYHSPADERVGVAGSPHVIGDAISPINSDSVRSVVDIKSVWNKDVNIGWLYRDSANTMYFQANRATETGRSWSVGAAKFIEISGSSPSGPGPTQDLRPDRSVQDQIPPHTQILDGFDRQLRSFSEDGRTAEQSPISIGDEIPNGEGGHTTVVAINPIEDSGRVNVGWEYAGADGHHYFQARYDTRESFSVSAGPAIASGGVVPPAESGVHRYRTGDIGPGEAPRPTTPGGRNMSNEPLGFDPSSARTLRDGQVQSGTIIAVDDASIFQNAGRGHVVRYDRESLSNLTVGDYATIQNRAGALTAKLDSPALGRGLERS